MSALLTIDALGVRIDLDVSGCGDDEAQAVRAAWRDAGASNDGAAEVELRVREDGDTADTAQLLERLSQRVTLAAIDARRGDLWMLHAAGLALPDGRVIVLVGPSGRGKTTASRTLGAHLGYASDETVAVDGDGRVFAYRKPLSIIEGGVYPKVQRAPSDVGLAALPDAPLRLAAIVLLDRREDAGDQPVITPVDLGDALEELVSQSSYLPSLPEPLQLMARLTASVGGVQRVIYREAATLLSIVDILADAGNRAAAGRVPARSAGVSRPPDPDLPLWSRTPTLDALELDDPDRIVLLQEDGADGGTVRVLAGIAPTLWRAASAAPRDELVAAAIAAHGEPAGADAGEAVDAALVELVDAGVLTDAPPEPVWRIRDDVAWTGSALRYVVLPPGSDIQPIVLNGSAALVWQVLAEREGSAVQISRRTSLLADLDSNAVEKDVREFLSGLFLRGVLSAAS
ncbi:PqqD family peptide modification chaperone [uncultured Microbacterium sp.]|uniref:PqqD family peptide modification chaperone n=1 Tax=uncultured Microbacterium sp. TaxID=191216 RepID=UPI002623232B|nr:PqqD family peptide modification chaperone [uncultured Microbacterium sp.]